MANPLNVSCPANVWTKVLTNVTEGQIKKRLTTPNVYLSTYRMVTIPAQPAPTLRSQGTPIFIESNSEKVENVAAINVYIYPVGAAGSVVVEV